MNILSSAHAPSPRKLPPWDDSSVLIAKHPELHHYTNRAGLEGILKSNSLWATHFSDLLDSSEVNLIKQPLAESLTPLIKSVILERQKKSFRERRLIEKDGGPTAVANSLALNFISANHEAAFASRQTIPLAEPYITSFCSHANDDSYEQQNGLLSQWRGYGTGGRYAIVFDTSQLDRLLEREWYAHYWVSLSINEVIYFDGDKSILPSRFPKLLPSCVEAISATLRGNPTVGEDTIASFISAATLLEHRAFSEEREVRIVGIPHSADAMAAHGARDHLVGWPPTKKVLQSAHSKKYLALFDGLGESLPIKRIIVGPSANQSDDLEFARLLTMGKVDVVLSRTPYIG